MAFDGYCTDPIIQTTIGSIGECEISCLDNLHCKSLTFKRINGETVRGLCELRSGNCSSLEIQKSVTSITMIVQGK